jgi:heme-degrading monooxygenase HmoA
VTTISKENDVAALINMFTVEPEKQQQLVDLWIKATDETIRHLPGFISANIHKSHDGTRVVNYAQWRSREDFEAFLRNPAAIPLLQKLTSLAPPDAHLYEVVEVIQNVTETE